MEKVKERNSNHELMRIISMLFIVIYHIIFHGHVLDNSLNPTLNNLIYIILLITMVHVNSFILLTGYYQCKKTFKQSALWKLINSTLFYKILIVILLTIFGYIYLDKATLLKEFFPINMTGYWFMQCYFLLYCISPFLNKLINAMSKKEFKNLLIVGLIIASLIPTITSGGAFNNNGHTLYNFIYLYFVGAYLRLYPVDKSYLLKKLSSNSYKLTLIIIFLVCGFGQYILLCFANNISGTNSLFTEIANIIRNSMIIPEGTGHNYSNPLVIIQSVAYFLFFTTLVFRSKFINKVATLVFGVYLIHENRWLRLFEYKWLKIDNGPIYSCKFLIYMILIAVSFYIVMLIIEFIRQVIFKFIYNRKISKKIRDGYYNWLHSFYIKD